MRLNTLYLNPAPERWRRRPVGSKTQRVMKAVKYEGYAPGMQSKRWRGFEGSSELSMDDHGMISNLNHWAVQAGTLTDYGNVCCHRILVPRSSHVPRPSILQVEFTMKHEYTEHFLCKQVCSK